MECTMRTLLSVLLIHRSNFEVLHWKAKGRHFDSMHNNVTTNYYDMISDTVDEVAELGMRMGLVPVNYLDAYREAKNCCNDIFVADASKDYSRDEIIATTDVILKNILDTLGCVLYSDTIQNERTNVGIKANLEGMYDKFDKELRFLNSRRHQD